MTVTSHKNKATKTQDKEKEVTTAMENMTYEVLHAEQSFAGSKKAKEMTGLDK